MSVKTFSETYPDLKKEPPGEKWNSRDAIKGFVAAISWPIIEALNSTIDKVKTK